MGLSKEMLYAYPFWLTVVSVVVFILERMFSWRRQKVLREGVIQDFFWLIFNGVFSKYFLNTVIPVLPFVYLQLDKTLAITLKVNIASVNFLNGRSFWEQFIVLLIVSDFIEWTVHNALHRIGFLWKFHRLHHSIKTMDWIGNFRFHWFETIIYSGVKYLPLALLGANWKVVLAISVFATLIGHLNHSNIKISWGIFRYILNSPEMHLWHHEKKVRGKAGVNFGIVLSCWDWIFKTAYMPKDSIPDEIGFMGEEKFSTNFLKRFIIPFID